MKILKVWCPDSTDEESAPFWHSKEPYQFPEDAALEHAEKRWSGSDYPKLTVVHIRTSFGELYCYEVKATHTVSFEVRSLEK